MNDKEQVVKHLELIQGVINRLGHDSFLVKGWSIAILSAAFIFVARIGAANDYVMLAFVAPVVGFWWLDSYYLWKERLFRGLYDDVRQQDKTNFDMDTSAQRDKKGCSWFASVCSITVTPFYVVEIVFVIIAWQILMNGNP